MEKLSPSQASILESLATVVEYMQDRLAREDIEPLYPLHADTSFKLDQLMEADSRLCQFAKIAVNVPAKMPKHKLQPGDLVVAGSCSEGCMLARWFLGQPKSIIFEPLNQSGEAVERAVNIADILDKFLSSTGEGKDPNNPDKMSELQTQAGLLASLIGGPSRQDRGQTTASPSGICGECGEASDVSDDKDWNSQAQGNKDPWEIEADILCDMGTIPQKYCALIQDIEERQTHAMVPFCQELKSCLKPGIWQKIESERQNGRYLDLDTQGFFDPSKVKKVIGILGHFSDRDSLMPVALAWIFRVPAKNVKVSIQSETTKTSHQFSINAQLNRHLFVNLASDFVGFIGVDFWPRVAREWISRTRAWPDESVIREIVAAGCGLVPRSEDDQSLEFKWSFSRAEKTLAQKMSKHQRKCYFLLKMMFYRYVKNCHSEMCSYMMKTVMLWVCEETPPSNTLWSPETLIDAVKVLLGRAERFFQRGNLPMFFIPKANLLEGKLAKAECQVVADRLSQVRNNLAFLIPFDIPYVVTAAMTQARAVSRLLEVVGAATDNTLILFMKMLMQEQVGDTHPEPYSFDQCWQEEVAAFLLQKELRKRKREMQTLEANNS